MTKARIQACSDPNSTMSQQVLFGKRLLSCIAQAETMNSNRSPVTSNVGMHRYWTPMKPWTVTELNLKEVIMDTALQQGRQILTVIPLHTYHIYTFKYKLKYTLKYTPKNNLFTHSSPSTLIRTLIRTLTHDRQRTRHISQTTSQVFCFNPTQY